MIPDLTPQIAAIDLRNDDYGLHYRTEAEVYAEHPDGERTTRGTAGLAVLFDIDGQLDYVYADLHQQGDVETLDRAIETLTKVRDELSGMYGELPRRTGRCYAQGFGGQCTRESGHDPDHNFPLPSDYAAAMNDEDKHLARTRAYEGAWRR